MSAHAGSRGALAAAATLLTCAVVGASVALDPRVFVAIPALGALAAVCLFAYRRPRGALTLAFLLVLVAGTKFSIRSETASLSGTVDASVVMELGLYALAAVITGLTVLAPGFPARRLGRMEWPLVAFTAFAFASTVWSDAPTFTFVRSGQLAILVALGMTAVRRLDVAGTMHALGTMVVAYALACTAVTVAFPGTRVTSTVALAGDRFSWFAMHSISTSMFTATSILYLASIALFVPGGWRQRRAGIPVWLALVPLAAVMVAANSRGPLFALLGALAAMVAAAIRPVASLAIAAAAACALFVGSIAGVTPESLLEDAARSSSSVSTIVLRGQDVREFGTLTGRTELWADLLPLHFARPVAGYGYQASRAVLLRLRPWAGHAHNAVLQTLLDVGWVGTLLLWVPFFAACLRPRVRPPFGGPPRWEGAAVFAASVFMLLNSVSDVSPAGGPAFETLLFLCTIMTADRLAARELPAGRVVRSAGVPVWDAASRPA